MSRTTRLWLLMGLAVAGVVVAAQGWVGDHVRAHAFCAANGGMSEMQSADGTVTVFCASGSGVSWPAR